MGQDLCLKTAISPCRLIIHGKALHSTVRWSLLHIWNVDGGTPIFPLSLAVALQKNPEFICHFIWTSFSHLILPKKTGLKLSVLWIPADGKTGWNGEKETPFHQWILCSFLKVSSPFTTSQWSGSGAGWRFTYVLLQPGPVVGLLRLVALRHGKGAFLHFL